MALPTPELSWQYNVNQTASAGPNGDYTYRNIMFNIKQAMTTFGSNPWTVVSSSDASVADGNDNWTSTGSLNWGNYTNHSWIVLKQTGMSSNFQVCFDLDESARGANSHVIRVIVSENAGFGSAAPGSISSRPTATDEYNLVDGYGFPFRDANAPWQGVTHVQQSTDGSATRIFFMSNGYCPAWIIFQKAADANPAWTRPLIYAANTTENGSLTRQTYDVYNQVATMRAKISNIDTGVYLTGEGFGDGVIGENYNIKNDLDGTYPILPMGIACTTAGIRGRHGRLKDIWWGQTSAPPAFVGATYLNGASKDFIQIGHMIFPWNNTDPIIG